MEKKIRIILVLAILISFSGCAQPQTKKNDIYITPHPHIKDNENFTSNPWVVNAEDITSRP